MATEREARDVPGAGHRFRRENRLPDARSFSRVFEQPTRSRDKLFTVLCRANEQDGARIGLAISKKNCARASGRNRIKRLVRESFRQHREELRGLDFVVMNKPDTHRASNEAIFDSLEAHWRRCRSDQGRRAQQDRG